ncbi:MAG: hypothetical protein JST28_09975 [Acidobacteria bacterium]|nr:hypothetical protein [Acidobacteriota bacterium]
MTEVILDRLTNALRAKPRKLDELHRMAVESGSNWSADQLWLLFACLDGYRVQAGSTDQELPTISLGDRSPKEKLQEAIVEIVRSEIGRPVPAQKVFTLLPSEFVTSVAQILAIARETPTLEVFGPGLLRLRK